MQCGSHAVCTNTPGSYICNCDDGYEASDSECQGMLYIDEDQPQQKL